MMKLLIAHDGSSGADAAILDLQRAGLPGAGEAVVMSVADVWLPPELPPDPSGSITYGAIAEAVDRRRKRADEMLAQARALAEQASARIRGMLPGWTVTPEAAGGSPGWELLRKADTWVPDLVAMGSAGRGALGRLAFGSVTRQVLTHAHVSVRIGRPLAHAAAPGPRVVAGLDGSACSDVVVDVLASRTWPAGTQVRLVVALDDVLLPAVDPMALPHVGALLADEMRWAQELAERAAARLRERGLDAQPAVRPGDPRRTLLDEAAHWNADCIFVGARGVRGFDRVLLGSVSASVAERAACSVEVVRKP